MNRSSLIKKNITGSFIIKGWSVLVQFILVRLTLNCLGSYENGIWLVISSMLLWIDSFDIGLGNGLRNMLAVFLAQNDKKKAQEVVSSTFFMLIIIIVPTAIALIFLINVCNVYSFLNIDKEIINNLDEILSVATLFVCSTFIFKFIGNFYLGLQLPAINNLLITCGNTLILIGTTVIYFCGIHSLLLIAIINTASPLLVYLISYPYTFHVKYPNLCPAMKFVNKGTIMKLFNTGVKFFILQIAGIVLFMSSNLFISKLFTPEMVTPFQIAYRYFTVILMLFTIICVPYWTATTDAYAKNDIKWIKKTDKTLNKLMVVILVVILVMIAVSNTVYRLWIGNSVEIPFQMTIIMAMYMFILVLSTRYSYILNGLNALNLQLIFTIAAAIIFIPLAWFVTKSTNNINYLLIVMCLVNIPGLLINIIQYHKIIKGNAHGIWKK